MLRIITNNLILLLGVCVFFNVANATELKTVPVKNTVHVKTKPINVEAEHKRAVALARKDKIDEGLAILKGILKTHPNNYPVRRDYVVITTWKDDCDDALANYQFIAKHPDQESYLVIPVSECLHQVRKDTQALALLKKYKKANPDDKDLQQSYRDMVNDIRLDRLPIVSATLGNNNSDAGNKELFWEVRYSQLINKKIPQLRGYIHYYNSRAIDSDFATGDLHRLGVGGMYWFNNQWMLDQELFTDLHDDESGSRTQLHFYPISLLHLSGEYSSNAIDVPLRAKALNIRAHSLKLDADFHTPSYRWELYGAVAKYDFTDSNDRHTFYGSAGYAYLMKPHLEQRVIAEYSRSTNTLPGTVYYNPSKDSEVDLTHKTSYVYDSRYDRHVDNLSVFVGRYNEAGYDAGTVYGVQYEQQYDFNALTSLSWSVGYASRIYDGNREGDTSFLLTASKKLDK